MGKLLRKKTTVPKKKKRPDEETIDLPQGDSAGDGPVSQPGAGLKPTVVKRPPQIGQLAPKPKTAPWMKIAFIEKSIQFLREVKVELKKVAWPSRKQTIGSTIVVLILVFIISFFLGIVDFGLLKLVKIVL